MRKFWSFYDNGKYKVGCSGAIIYVYDQNNTELGRFKNIPYSYNGAFQPNTNIFVAKSTAGMLGVYDLDKMEFQRKIVANREEPQDDGFTFSIDGAYFYNIEHFETGRTQLVKYRTDDFTVENIYFRDKHKMCLRMLEFDEDTEIGYLLGFMRDEERKPNYGFIGKFIDEKLEEIKMMPFEEYEHIREYKIGELSGYTEKQKEWLYARKYLDRACMRLKDVYESLGEN